VKRQRSLPLAASIASVFPYVVVMKKTSRTVPLILTPCR
jgi:hypothetical protein